MSWVGVLAIAVTGLWLYGIALIVFKHDVLINWIENWQRHYGVGRNSIQEAVEIMTDGVMFADLTGHALLVNSAMLGFMERLFGRQFRNAEVFFAALQEGNINENIRLQKQENQCLVFFEDGSCYRVARKQMLLPKGSAVWEYIAANISEEMALTEQLEQQNLELENKNSLAEKALLDLETAQRKKTTDAVKHKIHDVLGQRISILQKVLTEQELQNYAYIAGLVDDVMSDLRKDLVNPAETLRELVEVYKSIGIEVIVNGKLPAEQKQAEILVSIARDALSNAVRHGKASQIRINLGYFMSVEDDGIGSGEIHMGTGLTSMDKLLKTQGGRLLVQGGEHFVLRAEL